MGTTAFIGEITMFPYTFAPRFYTWCEGQIVAINQYTSLFSIIGSVYGGDGYTSMGIPNLKGRTPINSGNGPGLSVYNIGDYAGLTEVTLAESQLPVHNHELTAVVETPSSDNVDDPTMTLNLAQDTESGGLVFMYTDETTSSYTAFAPEAVSVSGINQSHENRQPYLALQFCIALEGIYPPRN